MARLRLALLLLLTLAPAALAHPTAWTVGGLVTDPEARPLAGATVDVWENESVESWGVPTVAPVSGLLELRSDDGRFAHETRIAGTGTTTLSLPVGVPGVVVLRPWGYSRCGNGDIPYLTPVLRRAVVGGEHDLTLQVHRGRLRGRVRGVSGVGRAAQVSVHLPDGETRSSRTNDRGMFEVLGVPPGEVRLVVTDGPDRVEATVVVEAGAQAEAPLTLP